MCYCTVRVVLYPVKGRVDVVLIEEDFRKGVKDAYIPYVSPIPALGRDVGHPGNIGGITLVHKIVECARICILNDVTRGVNHNLSLAIAEDKTDRRQK